MQRIQSNIYWWNKLLPITFIFVGTSITAIALAADLLSFGGPQGIGPRQAALALSGLAIFLAGIVLISSDRQRYLAEWLLVALATLGVVFASDLLVINGLPEFLSKQLVVSSIAFGILSIRSLFPSSTKIL